MKKIGLLSLLTLLPITISGCSLFKIPDEKVFDKTKLDYTYEDYMANNAYGMSSCPTHGNVNILVVPVWFTDSFSYIQSKTNKDAVLSDIDKAFNGTSGQTGWNSVSSYYEEESNSILKLNAVVSEWYECGTSSSTFARSYAKVEELVESATSWYFKTHEVNRTDFDSDKNGYLDAVIFVYGAPDYHALNSKKDEALWAYTSWLINDDYQDIDEPGPNVFMWASYDFMYSESTAFNQAGTGYGTGDTRHCSIDAHTFIHEMGHVLGLEDYYDYSDHNYTPAGCFSMQDYNVGGHDPYSVMAYGWADPIIPDESATVTIKDFQSSHDVILLANHEVNSPFDEYMLIELYTPTGLNAFDSRYQYSRSPKGPARPGIRLWHVDARLLYINNPSRISEKNLTTNPLTPNGEVLHAFSNTYDKTRGSILAKNSSTYIDYNILQLIRDDTSMDYRPTDYVKNEDLFLEGSSYKQSTYSSQFVYEEKMNNEEELGWRFTVNELSANSATISLYKLK